MFPVPISEACLSEVLARVTYRVIEREWRRWPFKGMEPAQMLSCFADNLSRAGFLTISLWILAYKRQHTPLYNTHDILEQFIIDARRGLSWRSVAYPQYKSHRRDPRVTNRGVTTRRVPEGD